MTDYYTVSEYAKMTGKDPAHIRRMLIYGRLLGEKIGNQWVIPKDAEYPADNRVKSGNYRNWRKKLDIRAENPVLYKSLFNMSKSFVEIFGDNLDRIVLYHMQEGTRLMNQMQILQSF